LLKICQQHAADKKGEVLYCNVTACLSLLIWLSNQSQTLAIELRVSTHLRQ
jgi:hypothetical protein